MSWVAMGAPIVPVPTKPTFTGSRLPDPLPPESLMPPSFLPRCSCESRQPTMPRERAGIGGSMQTHFSAIWEVVADAVPDQAAVVQGTRRVAWREYEDR